MRLFICSTPYHIFNAINIVHSSNTNDKADLFILDYSKECVEIYQSIDKNNTLFDKVLLIEVKNTFSYINKGKISYMLNAIKKLSNAITKKKINSLLPASNKYDEIFIGGPDLPSQLIFQYYYNTSKSKLNLIEDGIYTYTIFEKSRNIKKYISKILYGYYYLDLCESMYIYNPKLIFNPPSSIKLVKIPYIDRNDLQLMGFYKNYIIRPSEARYEEKIILFDAAFFNEKDNNKQHELFNNLYNLVDNENISLKLHPRTELNKYRADLKKISDSQAFEFTTINTSFNDKILISIISTACITPKLIFNEEPYVIFLFKLFEESNQKWHYTHKFFENFVNTYSNNKVFIPNNIKELEDILSRIK